MRQLLGFVLKAGISVGLFWFAVSGVNLEVIGERLRTLKIEWMIGALALCFVQYALQSARWQQISQRCGAPLTFRNALRINLVGAFFNQVLPSTVGGDAMRIWMLGRGGTSWTNATYSVLLDRFIGVLALAAVVVVCLPWTFDLVHDPVGRVALLVIGLGSIGAAAAFLTLGYLRWSWLQRWAPIRHLTQMSKAAANILFDFKTGGTVLALSFAIQCLTGAIAWCLARAIGTPLGFFPAIELIPPVMLISTVPISVAGWGVREKSLVLAFGYAGLSQGDGFLVSVLLGLTMLTLGLAGGVVWLTGSDRAASRDARPDGAALLR
jgi:uncharacterized membrane protein YbhN (UPF0104 family)